MVKNWHFKILSVNSKRISLEEKNRISKIFRNKTLNLLKFPNGNSYKNYSKEEITNHLESCIYLKQKK